MSYLFQYIVAGIVTKSVVAPLKPSKSMNIKVTMVLFRLATPRDMVRCSFAKFLGGRLVRPSCVAMCRICSSACLRLIGTCSPAPGKTI
ncbi:hypothetical protein Ppro_3152 [Pelobacter propionicus DSM 2379]|uniref:Uncharacterized protein n=1 Tax=Pelobacter propionicus (strain DSM 2379 / NBRC 103807 / OttBd1) TaxID=338966 RepID=A1ATS5_PELPD|nr:hypothetical protein Ppro_3152 [Pelobacter propionicus DSM 2379]